MRSDAAPSVDAIPEFAYRRVLIRGVFDHSREMLLGPFLRDGRLCYSLITPLVRDDAEGPPGATDVLINRGAIDRDLADQAKRPASLDGSPVTVVGMLRSQQRRPWLASDNRPDLGQWIFADIKRMSEHAGTQPVLLDEIFGAPPRSVHCSELDVSQSATPASSRHASARGCQSDGTPRSNCAISTLATSRPGMDYRYCLASRFGACSGEELDESDCEPSRPRARPAL